ncbi:MAG: iron-containing redox enzyme family protein [Deltaproteobacteria bacterium]|nr:iron-containing redox enzyme family protein [Deltaproteobacteria bacterium]
MKTLIARILKETSFEKNPYFVRLTKGTFSKADFIETQIQFFNAVIFFSRPMSALAAKIPSPELRMEILRNVWEEHGEGDVGRHHSTTFLEFLVRMDGIKSSEDLARRALWPEVRIFNTTLAGACVLDDYLIGVGMMGMIERMFCEISNWIGKAVVARGWLAPKQMIHYNLHKKLDIRHSQDFFAVLAPAWEASRDNRYYIEQGLWLGATLFNNLYEGLYRHRGRRLMRDTLGPHSRAEGAT